MSCMDSTASKKPSQGFPKSTATSKKRKKKKCKKDKEPEKPKGLYSEEVSINSIGDIACVMFVYRNSETC